MILQQIKSQKSAQQKNWLYKTPFLTIYELTISIHGVFHGYTICMFTSLKGVAYFSVFFLADFPINTKTLWHILHLSVLRGQHPENLNDLAWRNEDLEVAGFMG